MCNRKTTTEAKNQCLSINKVDYDCEEPPLGLSQLDDETDRRRVPLQDEDHPGNDPHLVPGFPHLCSGTVPKRFRSVYVSVGSTEVRQI